MIWSFPTQNEWTTSCCGKLEQREELLKMDIIFYLNHKESGKFISIESKVSSCVVTFFYFLWKLQRNKSWKIQNVFQSQLLLYDKITRHMYTLKFIFTLLCIFSKKNHFLENKVFSFLHLVQDNFYQYFYYFFIMIVLKSYYLHAWLYEIAK